MPRYASGRWCHEPGGCTSRRPVFVTPEGPTVTSSSRWAANTARRNARRVAPSSDSRIWARMRSRIAGRLTPAVAVRRHAAAAALPELRLRDRRERPGRARVKHVPLAHGDVLAQEELHAHHPVGEPFDVQPGQARQRRIRGQLGRDQPLRDLQRDRQHEGVSLDLDVGPVTVADEGVRDAVAGQLEAPHRRAEDEADAPPPQVGFPGLEPAGRGRPHHGAVDVASACRTAAPREISPGSGLGRRRR